MSLDVTLTRVQPTEIFTSNITHNLTGMAEAAGIYRHLWRPEEIAITRASQLIPALTVALAAMKADPDRFKAFNSPNGWGKYEHFVKFVEQYLDACIADPDTLVSVDR